MLGNGQVLLDSSGGKPSGGLVDTGLVKYMDHFSAMAGKADVKLDADDLASARTVQWSGENQRVTQPGTAYYFPALYIPQAIGLWVGKATGMTVDRSYRLARLLALFVSVGVLYWAFRLFPPPALVLALLLLPMSTFLLSFAVLDGMSASAAVLAFSAFWRYVSLGDRRLSIMMIMLAALGLLTACRANSLPFLLIPFVAAFYQRDKRLLISAGVLSAAVIAWTLVTIKTTVYPAGARDIDHMARLTGYLLNPFDFLGLIHATVISPGVAQYYAQSFLGVLGWLDAPLGSLHYAVFVILLLGSLICSISWNHFTGTGLARWSLVIALFSTILLTFLAMLVQWTIGDSPIIQGVQGRYFFIPAIAFAYAIGADPRQLASPMGTGGQILVFLVALATAFSVTPVLVARYYLTPEVASAASLKLTPSPVLTQGRAVPLRFPKEQLSQPRALAEIRLLVGTYMRQNAGQAELRLWSPDGDIFSAIFELDELVDNGYKSFSLDGKAYTNGEIRSKSKGEGISIWEVRQSDGDLDETCVVLVPTAGEAIRPLDACPLP
ncbi:hypothetical protein BEN78_03345 [Xanthomonas citri pv. mangiferaeindicae]|nr:hypothetical protein BEN78_03345 [Xanthomonas citri pv. mangiferaeindicae]